MARLHNIQKKPAAPLISSETRDSLGPIQNSKPFPYPLVDNFQKPRSTLHLIVMFQTLIEILKAPWRFFSLLIFFCFFGFFLSSTWLVTQHFLPSVQTFFSIQLNAYFDENISKSALDRIQEDLIQTTYVQSVFYRDKSESFEQLQRFLGAEMPERETTEIKEAMPTRLQIMLHAQIDDQMLAELSEYLMGQTGAGYIQHNFDSLKQIRRSMNLLLGFAIGLCLLLMVILILSYYQSVQLRLLKENTLLKVSYLVGATPSYIRLPICYQSFWLAIIGTSMGGLMTDRFYKIFITMLFNNRWINAPLEFPPYFYSLLGGMVMTLALFSFWINARLTTHLYLKQINRFDV